MPKLVIVLITIATLVGCGVQRDHCDGKERIVVDRAELRTALVAELTSAGVWVEEGEDQSICYDSRDSEFVLQRLKAIDVEQRPRNRIVVPSGVGGDLVFSRLHVEDIHFEVIRAECHLVLVFDDEETAARAFVIVGEVFSDLAQPGSLE